MEQFTGFIKKDSPDRFIRKEPLGPGVEGGECQHTGCSLVSLVFVENPKEEIDEKQRLEVHGCIGHCEHGCGRLRRYPHD
jgi:hypothetical protein